MGTKLYFARFIWGNQNHNRCFKNVWLHFVLFWGSILCFCFSETNNFGKSSL